MKVNIADKIAQSFRDLFKDIWSAKHTHYFLKGGRGSTKSSFISIVFVLLLVSDKRFNGVVYHRYHVQRRDTIFEQIVWAIDQLKLSDKFELTVSPMQAVYKPTGQKIIFMGADKAEKSKSIKFSHGYPALIWFEELDMFESMAKIRKILQSLMRGGDKFRVFYSFNPPQSVNNWVNKLTLEPPDNALVHTSDYREVPQSWLGQAFLDEALILKKSNETAYKHEYLGEITGTGAEVFPAGLIDVREITEEEKSGITYRVFGVDWGYVHPWVFVDVGYNEKTRTVYVLHEETRQNMNDSETAPIVREYIEKINSRYANVWCDAALPGSIRYYKTNGVPGARAGFKQGANRPEARIKWLRRQHKIVIDKSCKLASQEFTQYEYLRNKQGEITESLPGINDDVIDAVGYALSQHIKKGSS